MESPGEHLKREREHRGVSLQKIFESTRVPIKYLEAIEADRVDGLPQTAFVKGYIRNYCKVLGLDENDAVLRYEVWLADRTAEAEAAGKPKPVKELKKKRTSGSGNSTKPEPSSPMRPYLGKAVIIAAGVIIVILAYALTKRDLSVPEALPEPAVQAVVEPATPEQAVLPVPEPQPQAPEMAVSAAPPQQPASSGVPMVLAPAPQKPVQQPAVKPVQAEPQPAQKATQPEPVKKQTPGPGAQNEGEVAKAHTLIANARDTVWMKVGIDKEEPVEVLLQQGERFTWRAAENISVIVGNAGGVTLTYNGKDLSGLGASGEVVGLRLPSGTSYKIKKPQPLAPQPVEPQLSPAINMPEIPAPQPQPASGQ